MKGLVPGILRLPLIPLLRLGSSWLQGHIAIRMRSRNKLVMKMTLWVIKNAFRSVLETVTRKQITNRFLEIKWLGFRKIWIGSPRLSMASGLLLKKSCEMIRKCYRSWD